MRNNEKVQFPIQTKVKNLTLREIVLVVIILIMTALILREIVLILMIVN